VSDSATDEFLAALLQALADFFEPIERAGAGPESLNAFLRQVGWTLDAADATTLTAIGTLADAVIELADQADELASGDEDAVSNAASAATLAVVEIASGVAGLAQQQALPAPFKDPDLPEKVLDLLVYDYLAFHKPQLFAILRLAGILDEEFKPRPQGADELAVDYVERQLVLSRVADAVTDPGSLPGKVYGWGTPHFRALKLLRVLESTAAAFGLAVSGETDVGMHLYWDANAVATQAQRSLTLPIWSDTLAANGALSSAQLDLVAVPIPPKAAAGTATDEPEGIALFPRFKGQLSLTIELVEGVDLTFSGGIEDEGLIRAELRPSGSELKFDLLPQDMEEVSLAVRVDVRPDDPFVVLGTPQSSRLEIAQAHGELGIGMKLGVPQMHVDTGVDLASIVIDLGKGDGFLQKLLGGEPQQMDFGAGVRWSTTEGLRFNGTATLRLELPVHLDIGGVVQIDTIHVVLGATAAPDPGAQIEVSITGGLTLGPLAAQVDRLGVAMNLVKLPAGRHDGALGDMDLVFGFKPPNGLGFVVDAGPVKGGGYVSFDWEAGEYAGILQLEVADTFAIKAIGILATKMPDGRTGFSMLMIITAEFPPIQLGYGFSLNGVGGALGINRTMNRQFLTTGIHSGALGSILFPPDPVAHANEVISNLKQGFPIAEGRFLFGPMVKIAWGSSIITLEVGILLELPMPVRLALLGRFKCALPEAEDAILLLQLDVLGFVDFGTGDISIDATLFGSQVATFPITGGFALRINVGASPSFALSAGGFHPRFTAPPDFPKLERLGISISSGENPRLRLESYFAVTTNTVQTGARADFYVGADLGVLGSFSAQAELGFDALFHFGPFWFIVEIYGSVSIQHNGADLCSADLRFTLEGVTPWHVYGHAIVHFFGDHELRFDRTFGEPAPLEALPPVDVAKRVREAIALETAWGAQSPSDAHSYVTLRDTGAAGLLLHPLSELSVHQRVAPLKTQLDKFGSGPIDGAHTIAIDAVTIQGMATQGVDDLDDAFVPGQFFEMTDDEKFKRPAFERLPAGVKVKTSAFSTATAQKADQHYVTITVDNFEQLPTDDRLGALTAAYRTSDTVRSSMVEFAAAGQSQFSRDGRYAAPSQDITMSEPGWAIAARDDLSSQSTHATYTAAARVARDAGTSQIVSDFEAVVA
jgi:uncharacterized protein DUF6603